MDQIFNNDVSDIYINLTPILVGIHNCNVNRLDQDLVRLVDFSDTFPFYDKENGLHFKITSKKSNKPIIVHLNEHVAQGLLMDNTKKMTQDEYFNTFVEQKTIYLKEHLIKNTFSKGYDFPSDVQSVTAIELIQRKDQLIQFKSGTGKTHAFLFGSLWGFDPCDKELQYIFITSSHEVALQIFQQCNDLIGKVAKIALCIGHKQVSSSVSSGGFKPPISTSSLTQNRSKEEQREITSAQILVCTMGKFYDFYCNRKVIYTKYLKAICVDEFDNIISSGVRRRPGASSIIPSTEDQIAAIMKKIPEWTQRIFFSATISYDALTNAKNYFRNPKIMDNPLIILLNSEDSTLDAIRQFYVISTSFAEKKEILVDLIKQCRISQSIVFANSITTANEIKNMLDQLAIPMQSSVFHGNLSEHERQKICQDFKNGSIRLLISTDVTARGFDAQSVNVVFNYDMPEIFETYIHRAGRAGRYGRKGVCISIILVSDTKNELQKIVDINHRSKSKIEELPENLANLL